MSKHEKIIDSKNNSFVLSNIKFKQSNINTKSTSNQNKKNTKIQFLTEVRNDIELYKENNKNAKTEIENNKIEDNNNNSFKSKYKSVNHYNYYTHSHSNNNLLDQTKSVLGMSHYSILNKIKMIPKTNNITSNKNMIKNKKIIEVEYEKDYKMEASIKEDEKNIAYDKERINMNILEPISDSILNFDYSRYTNKDRKNGSYYFKQRKKYDIAESNTSTNNISNISDEDNKNNNVNITNKDKDISWRNKKNIKNINKKNSFSFEYNNNKLFSFKDEINMKTKDKLNDTKKNNKNILEQKHQTFDENNFNKYNKLNFVYNKNNKSDILDINNNTINNNNEDNRESKKYFDSLENINQDEIEESPLLLKKPKNQYHYNIKLTRNITRNDIQAQMHIKNRTTKNNFIPSVIEKNNLVEEDLENVNPNIYNKNQNICKSCNFNICPKCKCIKPKNQDSEEENIRNLSNINIYNNNIKIQNKSSSLPKNYFVNTKYNYNLDYSTDSINTKYNNIYGRNHDINKMILCNTNNKVSKNIYRNCQKINNNNFKTNKSCYYLESSYKNNNFKINKINENAKKNNISKNKRNNKYNKNGNNNTNNLFGSNKFKALYNLFLDFIKQDSVIETMRQLLSSREDSNLLDLFSLFNHSNKNLISASDFIQSLKEFEIFINMDDIVFLFRKFNKKLKDSFDFDEFSEIILPKKHSNEKIMGIGGWNNFSGPKDFIDKNNKNDIKRISNETKKMLGLLFKNVIDGEKSNESYRKILAENKECSGFDLFNKIKKNYSVGIYKEDIANFMKKYKYKLSNKEIELIMNRFDKNKNGMIDYKEFIVEISPINKKEK